MGRYRGDGSYFRSAPIRTDLALITAERAALLRIRDVGTYRSSVLDDALVQLDAAGIGIRLREQRD